MNREPKNILLVEDEALIAMGEKARLEQFGYHVTTADSGEKAIETVKANAPVDLILMDIDLGLGVDGTDAARAILDVRDIPIVFLSSHMEPEIVDKTEKITSYGYVVKSSSITVLDASIKMAFKLFEAKIAERDKELRLTRNERYLRSVLQTTLDGFWIVDADRRFLDVNDAYLRMIGYSREEFLRLTINDIDCNEDIETTVRNMARIKDAGAVIFETRHRTKDGRILDVAVSVTYLDSDGGRYLGFFRDITARKTAEAALRASEAKYKHLFNTSGIGMFRTRLDGSEALEFNEKYLSILGMSREECEGKPSVDLWADPKQRARMVEILRAEGHVENFKCKMIRADGVVIDCLTSLKLYPEQGILEGSIMDITERKTDEDRIRALLEEKKLLLKEIHHRVKNSMNSISGLLLMQAMKTGNAAAAHMLEDAERRVKSMILLYDKLHQSPDFEKLSLKEYLPTLASEIASSYPHGSRIRIEERIDDFSLSLNKLQPLGIILNELVTNAMKYAFVDRESGVIAISATRSGNHVSFTVQDDGQGIPDSIGFDTSTGFGLTLIKGLAEQLGGAIRMERSGGTRIVLEFDD